MMRGIMRTARYARSWKGGADVAVQEIEIDREGQPVAATLFLPREAATLVPGWIAVGGASRLGRFHPQLVRFAGALAASGAAVLVPEVPEWRRLSVSPRVIGPTLRASIAALRGRPEVEPGRFGAIGFSFGAPVLDVIAGIGLMLLFGYAFSWVFAFVGLVSSSPESSQAFGFIVIFPLTFISSAFVPVDSMPMVLQAFAEVNPFTITVDAMRALWLGAPAGNNVWEAALWAIGIAAVFAALSVNRYKRAVTR